MVTHWVFGEAWQGALNAERIEQVLTTARTRQEALAKLSVEPIIDALSCVGAAWATPGDPDRERLLAELPELIGFSREMVELELGGLTRVLQPDYLRDKIEQELGAVDALDWWHRRAGGTLFQKATPLGCVLHVASGNVSTTGVLSMVEGLLTRNVNILKVATRAPLMPQLFIQRLMQVDPTGVIASSLVILSWDGRRERWHEAFGQKADAIVVWGGDEVVATYRAACGPHTRLIVYGPRVSVGLLASEALGVARREETARGVALDVALWDQNACSSPQVIYCEEDGAHPERVVGFVQALGHALDELARELPMGALSEAERAEITKEREMARVDQALGQALLHRPASQAWTIIQETDPAFRLSVLSRTIIVKRVPALEAVPALLAPWQRYLQTVGIAANIRRSAALADACVRNGALRVTRIGAMSDGACGEPHDGQFGLMALVKWVSWDAPGVEQVYDGLSLMAAADLNRLALARRDHLLRAVARHTPFYRDGLPQDGVGESDWSRLPLLDRARWLDGLPPHGRDAFGPGPDAGGHWLRTGGSTGAPRLSIYSFKDYEADMWRAARGAFAAGLRRGDRVANLFFAGDLYGSYLSVNRALEILGCHAFSLTNHASIEAVSGCLNQFDIRIVVGLSSWVQAVLTQVHELQPELTIDAIYYAGEPFPERDQQFLRDKMGVRIIRSIGYGAVDAGPIGFQCEYTTGGVHHVHTDHVFVEILDPDHHGACEHGELGEVVVTALNRRLTPLLRYRAGDLARWVPGDCPCGHPARRLELVGRVDDRILLGARSTSYHAVTQALQDLDWIQGSPQVVVDGDALTVRVALQDTHDDPVARERALRAALAKHWADHEAWAKILKIEMVDALALERVGRSGKIVRVVDRRHDRA